MSLTLYYHPLSSFCFKVLIALYENDVEFDRRVINLSDPADKAELQAIWPICKFPVIRDHVRKRDLPEATIIIEYLDHFYAGEHKLIPGDWDEGLDARLWDRFCDNYLQLPMQHIVADRMSGSKGDVTKERATLTSAYEILERRLASRIWLSGKSFSLADCAAAPGLFYAGAVQPIPAVFGHVHAYFDRLTQRPSFQRVLEEAKPFLSWFPFAEAIPSRFRS